jgi:transcriptional/translational regulatory protein YebC/TACO1
VCRTFSSSTVFLSGHSKWSTIKHDKAKNDKAKSKERQMMSKEIASATQCKRQSTFMSLILKELR